MYTYFFNDAGSSWRTRAAVSTSVGKSDQVAKDLATHMAETFEAE